MNEDRKTNEDEGLPDPSGESPSGGPEALLELVLGKPGKPGTAEPAGSPAEPLASGPVDEEDALRDLFHGAVLRLEPSGDALERLRRAVPARRVRNRRILVAAAAAVVVLGGSVPIGLYVTSAVGGNSDRSLTAGHGQTGGNSSDGSDLQQNGSGKRPKPKRSSGKDKDGKDGKDKDAENGGASASPTSPDGRFPSTGGTDVTPPRSPSTPGTVGGGLNPPPPSSDAPTCTRSQVGVEGSTRAPSAGGKVYGSFKVTNVSSRGCTVRGPETLTAVPASEGGAAVAVVSHVTGDPATGLLPDPSVETTRMVLAPNASYEVRFAWVPPEGGCPGANGSGDAETPEGGSGDTTDAEPGTDTGQTQAENPPLGAVVSHTPSVSGADGPATQTTIAEACGGTVYRTGVIPVG